MPWVITMKKNDHYFPTMEWIKDGQESCGWRRVTYEGSEVIEGDATDGVPLVAEEAETEDAPMEAGHRQFQFGTRSWRRRFNASESQHAGQP